MGEAAQASADGAEAPRRGRGRPAVGRTTPLGRDEIVERARRIISDESLAALSIRRLARELGVTPMAIYHHVPDKRGLLAAIIDDVWREITDGLDPGPDDLTEWMVAFAVRTRTIWLENLELANLAMAVAEVDDEFVANVALSTAIAQAAGFPDVGLAYGALQTFVMGSIATAANRRVSSAYFGRDPEAMLAEARRRLGAAGMSAAELSVVESRFDEDDTANFEPGLRALIAGLRAAPPRA